MRTENILIVDDSVEMLEVLRRHLAGMNFYTFQATNVSDAVEILKTTSIDMLITDLQMPGIHGMQLVKYVAEKFPHIPTLVITGFPSVSGAVEAIKSGVIDYLVKPFTQQELKQAVEQSLAKFYANHPPLKPVKKLKETSSPQETFGIIGKSEKIQKMIEIIHRVTNTSVTTLIQGESGTGKELVARAIHYAGKFAKTPFIAVNCGGIPENLLESELFGYEKGAFTGANETREGLFQAANGGTIFLDEIGNASLNVQARLLRVIQEKEVMKIGSTHPQPIQVRIIAATNADLLALSKTGAFREDLYYRLHVVGLEIPPLRERKEDIPLLVNHFLAKYSAEYGKSDIQVTATALAKMQKHAWPGNIRELENYLQCSIILANEAIEAEDLSEIVEFDVSNLIQTAPEKLLSLKELERIYIEKILIACDQNKSKAAEILGIDRKTLRMKISE